MNIFSLALQHKIFRLKLRKEFLALRAALKLYLSYSLKAKNN